MPSLPSLLKRLEALHRQHVQIEHEIASVEREIVAFGKDPKPRRKRALGRDAIELVKPIVQALQSAGEPLPRREIAARLGIAPSAVYYRLQKALAAGFVEKCGGGRYRASGVVPALQEGKA